MDRSPCPSKQGLNRVVWTAMEDMILSEYVRIHGEGKWRYIPKRAGLKRSGKCCRLRWLNYLRPDIKRGNISPDEEDLIIRLHRLLGNRWSLIAGRLPGRTSNEIKNYWNTHISRKLRPPMNECEHKTSQNLSTSSKSPVPVQNRVFKATTVKITSAVRYSEIVRPNGHNGDGCSNRISDESFKLCPVNENRESSSGDLLVNDSIGDEESERFALATTDNPVETAPTISTPSMWSLEDQQSPHCNHFAGDAATFAESLLCLNEQLSSACNLLPSASDCSSGFASEELYREMEELYDKAQRLDWIHEFDHLQKGSLLESEKQ